MSSLHSPENSKSEELVQKVDADKSVTSTKWKDSVARKHKGPNSVNESSKESTTKTGQAVPENRLKLKPEQSYKKETKASRLGKSTGRWTHQEHILFIEGLKIYGKNWKKVESYIGTRTGTQIRSHAQKFFNRIRKECSTDDPSKYVIENMWDESIKQIILEHCGEDVSNSNDEKDFSSDTPEVLFSITKEKVNKRKRDDVDSTPRSLGASGSAFKSFKREDGEPVPKTEDSKIHGNNTILQKPIWNKSIPIDMPKTTVNEMSSLLGKLQQAAVPQVGQAPTVNNLMFNAMLANIASMSIGAGTPLGPNPTLTYLLTMLNGGTNNIH